MVRIMGVGTRVWGSPYGDGRGETGGSHVTCDCAMASLAFNRITNTHD